MLGSVKAALINVIDHLYFHMTSDGEVVWDNERHQLESEDSNQMMGTDNPDLTCS